jgi:peptidyl-prolyl cis-trans isomerase SurA
MSISHISIAKLITKKGSFSTVKVKFRLGVLAGLLLTACQPQPTTTTSSEPTAQPLFTVADTQVYPEEFLYVYRKNNVGNDSLSPAEDMRQYLDLYVNFKLKVQEAYNQGLQNQPTFLAELEQYKDQLGQPYLTENSVTEELVNEAYARMQQEVRAAHILINVAPGAPAADTLKAYQKAVELKQKVLNGANFGQLAKENSDDPSAKQNEGDLGYFSALQMVYPFENAAYTTPVGKISEPTRTRFGYHLVKVLDKRPSKGKVRVAHLMVRTQPNPSAEQQEAAKAKVDEIYKRLQQGEEWDKLVRQFSEDRSTAERGGELQPFGTGQMIPSFEEAAFALSPQDSISEPVQTQYGWHIIKLIEKQPVPALEEVKEDLAARVKRDTRSQLQEEALINRLKQENNLQNIQENLEFTWQQADSSLLKTGRWNYKPDSINAQRPLFTIADSTYTLGEFARWTTQRPLPVRSGTPAYALEQAYKTWQKEQLMAYEEAHLADKYEDYRMLVKEYHDGILLFQLMEENVWNKALADTSGLKQYFSNNADQYQWQERLNAIILDAASPEILKKAEAALADSLYTVSTKVLPVPLFKENELNASARREIGQALAAIQYRPDYQLEIVAPAADTAGLRSYLNKTLKTSAKSSRRVTLFAQKRGKNQPAAAQYRLMSSSPVALEAEFNTENPLSLQVIEGPFERGDNPIADAVPWLAGRHTVSQDDRHYLVVIKQVLPAGPKELSEVRGQAITDYQAYLEKQWVSELKEKYPINVNQDVLNKLLQEVE